LQENILEYAMLQKKDDMSFLKFYSDFSKIPNDEYFFMFVGDFQWSAELKLKEIIDLEKLNGQETVDMDSVLEPIQDILKNYSIVKLNLSKKIRIGRKRKEDRICRFCKKSMKDGALFTNEAHAISEALGNKKIILNEECDTCNSYFDKEIERHLIGYLDFIRTLYKVPNKSNKVPNLRGKNYEFRNSNDGTQLIIYNRDHLKRVNEKKDRIILENHETVVPQNVYKSLVKFALSIIDSKYLVEFQKSIDWIRGQSEVERVPKIAMAVGKNNQTTQPDLVVYIRRNNCMNLPYAIGEFKFLTITFIFIIPTFKSEECDFLNECDFNHIWDCFKHYGPIESLRMMDFSSNNKQKNNFELNIANNKI